MFQGDLSGLKFIPYTPAMKVSGTKMLEIIVSTFITWFMRLLMLAI